MSGPAAPRLDHLVVGVSHRTATAALRERLFQDEAGQQELLRRLKDAGFMQALVLSTCDRTEVHAAVVDAASAPASIRAVLAAQARIDVADLAAQGYALVGAAAIAHLFAVAAALDSVVIGEPQVLGQVRDSDRLAAAAGLIGAELRETLDAAYGAAKRVRAETAIGERPVSMAAAAIQMARRVQGDLGGCAALLLGGGEMGELLMEQFRVAGVAAATVIHRSPPRALLIGRRLGGHVGDFQDLPAALAAADIVVAALGEPRPAVSAAAVAAALKARRQRPMLLIDSAIPGDVDRAVDRLDGAFLFDLGDLERLAVEGQAARAEAVAAARAIVEEEVAALLARRAARQATPAIVALRRHFEAAREQVLAENPSLDAGAATRLLVNRLLHRPSTVLRALAADATVDGTAEAVAIERLLARLFAPADGET